MQTPTDAFAESPQPISASTIDIAPSPPHTYSPSKSTSASIVSGSSATLHIHDDAQRHTLSTFRLLMAHLGLPTIASDLNATPTQYTWVGVAYMLTQTALQPLYGRISDLVGRKLVLGEEE
ncbi:hypothetical protein C0991_008777 [Blastosporella zonata]|nr:hypothetical protein C0991_008777 [Blastosporella zonata]